MAVSGHIGRVLGSMGLVAVACLALSSGPASAAPDPKAARAAASQVEQSVATIAETQKALAATLAELRTQVSDLQHLVAEVREEQKQKLEGEQGVLDQTLTQVKEMREEVRGLYVESSGIKGDIAQDAKQVETLDQSLSSFRLSAGIIVAVVIVLQLVLMGLTFRNRA